MLGASRHRAIWVINAACPSRCSYCDIASQRGVTTLREDEVARVAEELLEAGFREVVFVGGEPLLCPELGAALDVLRGRCTVAAFTGGIPGDPGRYADLVRRGIDRVVLSIDAGEDDDNDRLRGRAGITAGLIAMADAMRAAKGDLDLSINSVVTRFNADSVESVWERMRGYRPTAWALTLAGENFTRSPDDHWLARETLERVYLELVPRLALRVKPDTDLVVLPIPLPFLEHGVPPERWGLEASRYREALDDELDRFCHGMHNQGFVERYGCPLVGTDVSVGVSGELYPCSQAPILKSEFALGSLREASVSALLEGSRLAEFRAAVPHAPCRRCWAPSNVEPAALVRAMREEPRR
jgi:radical SAM protein with 4Fe4S-binding SPASM domain